MAQENDSGKAPANYTGSNAHDVERDRVRGRYAVILLVLRGFVLPVLIAIIAGSCN